MEFGASWLTSSLCFFVDSVIRVPYLSLCLTSQIPDKSSNMFLNELFVDSYSPRLLRQEYNRIEAIYCMNSRAFALPLEWTRNRFISSAFFMSSKNFSTESRSRYSFN